MPRLLIRKYADMVPVLMAEEGLHQVTAVSVGSGTMEKKASQKVIRQWTRIANRSSRREVTDPKIRMAETLAAARAMGIKVVEYGK